MSNLTDIIDQSDTEKLIIWIICYRTLQTGFLKLQIDAKYISIVDQSLSVLGLVNHI